MWLHPQKRIGDMHVVTGVQKDDLSVICSKCGTRHGTGHNIGIASYASSNTNSYSNLGFSYSQPTGHSYRAPLHNNGCQVESDNLKKIRLKILEKKKNKTWCLHLPRPLDKCTPFDQSKSVKNNVWVYFQSLTNFSPPGYRN